MEQNVKRIAGEIVSSNRIKKHKLMKEIKSDIDFLSDELGKALKSEIDAPSTFRDLERVTFLEKTFVNLGQN